MSIPYSYRLVRSDRRSISASVDDHGTLIVRIPKIMSDRQALRFLEENESRIHALFERVSSRQAVLPSYRDDDIPFLRERALSILPPKISYYANLIKVRPNRCRITSAKKRFGSCSSKGNINFSCFLMLFPDEAIDYVVVHELAHLKEMNHSKRFYEIIQKILPDYKARESILKGH